MTAVLTFPRHSVRRLEADAVRLGFDFSRWCAELYRGGRFLREVHYDCLDDARAEVERLQANGLRRMPDARPDWTAVAYGELSYGTLNEAVDQPSDYLDGGGDAA